MTQEQVRQAVLLKHREQKLRDYELRLAKDVIWLHTLCQSIISFTLTIGMLWLSMR